MSTVAAWNWFLPEEPPFWQWFFSGKLPYEGKICDSGSEVLQRVGCPQAATRFRRTVILPHHAYLRPHL